MSRATTWRSNIAGPRALRPAAGIGGRSRSSPASGGVIASNAGIRAGGSQGWRPRQSRSSFTSGDDPVADWACCQPQPAGRQHHGRELVGRRARCRNGWNCCTNWCPTATASLLCWSTRPTRLLRTRQTKHVEAAARTIGLQMKVLHASTERDIDAALRALVQMRAGGLVIGTDAFAFNSRTTSSGHWPPAMLSRRSMTPPSLPRPAA